MCASSGTEQIVLAGIIIVINQPLAFRDFRHGESPHARSAFIFEPQQPGKRCARTVVGFCLLAAFTDVGVAKKIDALSAEISDREDPAPIAFEACVNVLAELRPVPTIEIAVAPRGGALYL